MDMTDDELREFLRQNREKVESFIIEEAPEFLIAVRETASERMKDADAEARKRFDEATEKADFIRGEAKDFIDEQTKEQKDKIKQSVKELATAFLDPEVQRHFVNMGIDFLMGVSAFVKAVPKPGKVEKAVDKVSEMRSSAAKQYCAKNPDCPKKSVKKIELD